MDLQVGLSLLTFLAPSPVLPLVDPRFKQASPLTHPALNADPQSYGETPNATLFMVTKFKGGNVETVVCDFQILLTSKKAGANRKKLFAMK